MKWGIAVRGGVNARLDRADVYARAGGDRPAEAKRKRHIARPVRVAVGERPRDVDEVM